MSRTRKPMSVVFPKGLEPFMVRLEKQLGVSRSEVLVRAFIAYWMGMEIIKK